jgi:hypothetical protein
VAGEGSLERHTITVAGRIGIGFGGVQVRTVAESAGRSLILTEDPVPLVCNPARSLFLTGSMAFVF